MFRLVLPLATLLFQDDNGGTAAALGGLGGACCGLIFGIVLSGVLLMGVFKKAGQPTWAAFVPLYNFYILLKIVGRPAWWIIGLVIPVANLIVWFLISMDLAKSFGKDTTYGIGIFLLSIVFIPILGYGSAQYLGPSAPQDGSLM